jgi:hypothetical protein
MVFNLLTAELLLYLSAMYCSIFCSSSYLTLDDTFYTVFVFFYKDQSIIIDLVNAILAFALL